MRGLIVRLVLAVVAVVFVTSRLPYEFRDRFDLRGFNLYLATVLLLLALEAAFLLAKRSRRKWKGRHPRARPRYRARGSLKRRRLRRRRKTAATPTVFGGSADGHMGGNVPTSARPRQRPRTTPPKKSNSPGSPR